MSRRPVSDPGPVVADDPQRDALLDMLLIAASGLVFFGLNIDFLMRGDATIYANYVLLGRFDERTLHLGYYVVVWALQQSVGRLLNVPVHETMAALNVVCGALALAIAYRFARHVLGSRRDAVLVAFVMALCGRVLTNATSSELYMLQTVFVLFAMWQYVDERPMVAGVAAGAAMLVSPLSAFAFLFFPVWELTRAGPPNWKGFGALLLGGSLVYLPYLLVYGQDLYYGRRGLLLIRDSVPLNLGALTTNVAKYQFKHYTALLLLAVPAITVWRDHRRLVALTLAVAVPHLYVVVKLTSEDHTFLLNTDFFFVCWLVIGMRALLARAGWPRLAYVPLATHVVVLLLSGRVSVRDSHRDYADELRAIARTHLVDKRTVLISDWNVGISLTHFGRDSVVSMVEDDALYSQMFDLTAHGKAVRPLPSDAQLMLIDPWEPTPLNAFFRSAESLERQRELFSVRRVAERRLGLRCELLATGTHRLYRCERAASPHARVGESTDASPSSRLAGSRRHGLRTAA